MKKEYIPYIFSTLALILAFVAFISVSGHGIQFGAIETRTQTQINKDITDDFNLVDTQIGEWKNYAANDPTEPGVQQFTLTDRIIEISNLLGL